MIDGKVIDGKAIEHRQGDTIEITIEGEKVEGKETLNFIDALTDHLGITGIMTQVHGITMMIRMGRVTIVRVVQTDLSYTLIPIALEDSSGKVEARLKL